MKALARFGAILSFAFFFVPGMMFLAHATDGHDPSFTLIGVVLGLCTLGIAVFLGTILWLAGEKCCSKQDSK
jgi:hypothetical protein